MEHAFLELSCLVWHSRTTGRTCRSQPLPHAVAQVWLRDVQETGSLAFTRWLEPVGLVWGWTEGLGAVDASR